MMSYNEIKELTDNPIEFIQLLQEKRNISRNQAIIDCSTDPDIVIKILKMLGFDDERARIAYYNVPHSCMSIIIAALKTLEYKKQDRIPDNMSLIQAYKAILHDMDYLPFWH